MTSKPRTTTAPKNAPGTSGRAQRRLEEQQRARRRLMMLAGGVVALIAVVIGGLYFVTRDDDESFRAVKAPGAAIDASIPRDGNVLGDPNAPLTVIEYGDYQCPGCQQFAIGGSQTQLINDFVKTGKVKLEFKDFAFIGQESKDAAAAAGCAADQNKFWEFHDALYVNQLGENTGSFTKARLKEIAKTAGLDTGAFNSCIDKGTHVDAVTASAQEARSLGVTSTPSLVINGTVYRFTGYDDLAKTINEALTAAGA